MITVNLGNHGRNIVGAMMMKGEVPELSVPEVEYCYSRALRHMSKASHLNDVCRIMTFVADYNVCR